MTARQSRAPLGCVTVAEAAAILGMSRTTFDVHLKAGTLQRWGLIETNPIGRRRFFARKSLDAVLFARRTGGLRKVG